MKIEISTHELRALISSTMEAAEYRIEQRLSKSLGAQIEHDLARFKPYDDRPIRAAIDNLNLSVGGVKSLGDV